MVNTNDGMKAGKNTATFHTFILLARSCLATYKTLPLQIVLRNEMGSTVKICPSNWDHRYWLFLKTKNRIFGIPWIPQNKTPDFKQ